MIRIPPKKILVAFDFSSPAVAALRQGKALAARFKAGLEVLYVHETPPPMAWEYDLGSSSLGRAGRALIERRIRRLAGPRSAVLVVDGDPAPTILRVLRARRAEFLLLGTHARTGAQRLMLGSTAESVIRSSPVPTMVVRAGATQPLRSVLAPVNFQPYSDFGFTAAAGFAAALRAKLTVLHVVVDPRLSANPQFWMNALLARLPEAARQACRPRLQVEHGRPIEEIVKAARSHDAVAMAVHCKSALGDLMFGTTAQRVMREVGALLAVPCPKAQALWNARWSRAGAAA